MGLDLAWGEINQSGIAVVDSNGRLVHIAAAKDDASIRAALAPYVEGDCVVAIDAPLVVKNPSGARPAEIALNRDFQRFDAGARPAYTAKREFAGIPRGARLADALALDMDPASGAGRRAIEVYPHPATVVLFELGRTLKYKRGKLEDRQQGLLRLIDLIEGLDAATPRLRVKHNVAWAELRNVVAAATRQVHLDWAEDPVDATICAYVALYGERRPQDVTTYGDFASGYIVTPTLPQHRQPSLRSRIGVDPPAQATNLVQRLARTEQLLAEAQRELAAIRAELGDS